MIESSISILKAWKIGELCFRDLGFVSKKGRIRAIFLDERIQSNSGRCPICRKLYTLRHSPVVDHAKFWPDIQCSDGPVRDVVCSKCNSRLAIPDRGGKLVGMGYNGTQRMAKTEELNLNYDLRPYAEYVSLHAWRLNRWRITEKRATLR